MMEALLLLTLAMPPPLERSQQCKSNCAEENRSSAHRPSHFVISLRVRVNDLRAHERQPNRDAHHHEADNRRMHAVDSTPLQDDAVGSLGRVGNPFEVPVGMTQEEQGQPDYILRTGAVFLASLTVAEIEVTRAVIERGGRELNALYKPFQKHPGALGLVNGAVTGGLGLVALELNRRGKKTEARVFVWAMVAVKAVVFAHNVRQLRK